MGALSLTEKEYYEIKEFFKLGATYAQVKKGYGTNNMTTYFIKKSDSYEGYLNSVRAYYDKVYIRKKKKEEKAKKAAATKASVATIKKEEPKTVVEEKKPEVKPEIKPEPIIETRIEQKIVKELVMVVPEQIPEFGRFTNKDAIYMRGWSDALKAINEVYKQQ